MRRSRERGGEGRGGGEERENAGRFVREVRKSCGRMNSRFVRGFVDRGRASGILGIEIAV